MCNLKLIDAIIFNGYGVRNPSIPTCGRELGSLLYQEVWKAGSYSVSEKIDTKKQLGCQWTGVS